MDKKHQDLFALFRTIYIIIALIIGFYFNLWIISLLIIIIGEIFISKYRKHLNKNKKFSK